MGNFFSSSKREPIFNEQGGYYRGTIFDPENENYGNISGGKHKTKKHVSRKRKTHKRKK